MPELLQDALCDVPMSPSAGMIVDSPERVQHNVIPVIPSQCELRWLGRPPDKGNVLRLGEMQDYCGRHRPR